MIDSRTYPRDVFLYLLSIVTLITIAVSFGVLIYQYINISFPDVLNDGYFWSQSASFGLVRNSMAVLIVVFPVFIWVSWFLAKDLLNNPEKKDLKIRRWLLYLTLFVASLVIIGDLVALFLSFLNGELTGRFLMKIGTVLVIAGSIFVHYFSELREKAFSWILLFDRTIILIVVVSILSGFWIAGSPNSQREVRMDERRISDLSSIQYQVIDYWQRKEKLPSNLTDLANEISGFVAPKDPESGTEYSYRVISPLVFELCAEFSASNEDFYEKMTSPSPMYYPAIDVNWKHSAGRACFERKIDPDFYPPLRKEVYPVPVR